MTHVAAIAACRNARVLRKNATKRLLNGDAPHWLLRLARLRDAATCGKSHRLYLTNAVA